MVLGLMVVMVLVELVERMDGDSGAGGAGDGVGGAGTGCDACTNNGSSDGGFSGKPSPCVELGRLFLPQDLLRASSRSLT